MTTSDWMGDAVPPRGGDVSAKALNFSEDPLVRLLGIRYVEISADGVLLHMEADERHHTPAGIVHGGVYACLVETAGSVGALERAPGVPLAGVANSVELIRPHRLGRLHARGVPCASTGDRQLWQVMVNRADDGKLVATGRLLLQRITPDHPGAGITNA